MLSNITNLSVTPSLVYDPNTGTVNAVNNVSSVPGGATTPSTATCPDPSFTCESLFTCEEAFACYNDVPNFSLDANGDGLPCGCASPDANTVPVSEN